MSDRYLGGFIKAVQTPPTASAAPGIWTLEQASRYIKAGLWPQSSDPNFNQTVLLLHGDGTNGAQNNTFLDSSTNNFTITRNGNTTQGTFSPFSLPNGWWSNYFPGIAGFMLPNNSAFAMSGDFTYEAWVYLDTVGQSQGIITPIDSGADPWSGCVFFVDGVTNKLRVTMYGSGQPDLYHQTIMVANRWYHVALSRSGSTIRLYLDGVVSSTTATTSFSFTQSGLTVGSQYQSIAPLVGYLSNVRIVKGRAVYTSSFTPPSDPLGATSGGDNPPQGTETVLLTCQSNRFVDNSTNNFTITYNASNAQYVNAFSPFAPTAAYSASVNGGSGYFDGSGDGVTTVSSAMSYAGDFCIECFFYTNTTTTYACLYSDEASGTGATILLNNGSNNGQITTYGFGASNFASTTTGLNNNAWHHVAITKSGTTVRLFIDGVLENTLTGVAVPGTTPDTVRVGTSYFAGRDFGGYISNFRIVVGSPVYTSTFTLPTAPLTAITNTSLLLNFTNAGIFDNTGKNNLETSADAQIDTTTKKYGTGSMEFDGNGDYLVRPASDFFAFGTGDFTIEYWAYKSANGVNGYDIVCGSDNDGSATNGWYLEMSNTRGMFFYVNNATGLSYSFNPNTSTWTHYALVRSNGTVTFYINGTSAATGTFTTSIPASNRFSVGAGNLTAVGPGLFYFNGFIDDLRITKGVARYTTTFTPPGGPFPNQ